MQLQMDVCTHRTVRPQMGYFFQKINSNQYARPICALFCPGSDVRYFARIFRLPQADCDGGADAETLRLARCHIQFHNLAAEIGLCAQFLVS